MISLENFNQPSMACVTASIVLYNHTKEQLTPTLSSLINERRVKQIILIDNSDCHWARHHDFGQKIIYVKSSSNCGYGAGHNQAIKAYAGQTKFFLVCNPDISFESGTLESLISFAENSPSGLWMPNIKYPNGDRQELCKLLPNPLNLFARRFFPRLGDRLDQHYLLKEADYDQSFFVPSLSGCFMLFRSSTLQKVGGFDERFFMYLEDIDLSRRVADLCGATYVPNATVIHEFQKESYRNPVLFKAHIVSAFKYFNKWGWLFDKGRRKLNRRCITELPIINR